ncbi:hypothetical protein BDR03DRAFT_189902 [Suillus americanus]|nr:hypothetical protein BDR03DRAFT_189902 [Suillus americanus]
MHLVRFFTYITSCLSVVRAFSVTVGTPTQCDPLTISWTGGQPPFKILLTPYLEMYQNYSIPSSAFSNGKGSYSISQLLLSAGKTFLLTMSDATGFGSGGTTNNLTVGNSVTNNNCNIPDSAPPFEYTLSPLTQCSLSTIATINGSPVLPITIVQLIPAGQPAVSYSNRDTFTFVVGVNAGTDLLYFVTDSEGNQGGVSGFEQVSGSGNSSCLGAGSPSSTGISATATASPTSSSSNSSSSSNVALIAGAAGGGGAVLIALIILGMCLWRKRRSSRSPDVLSSTTSHPRRLQHTDPKHEVSRYSDMTNSSAGNFAVGALPSSLNQTQHSRQSSNTDSSVYGDARSSTMSSAYSRTAALSQPMSPNYPLQYPVSPIRPGSQSSPLNTSTRNFAVSDRPTLHSRQSSNADFAVYGDARSSATMSSGDRRMATVAETPSPLPLETNPVSYLGPPIQSGSQPSPINASAADLAAKDLPRPFSQAQNSRQSPDTDTSAVYGASGRQSVAPAGAQTAAAAAGHTDYQPPTRIIVHVDADDIVPDDNGIIELPPQYSEHRGVHAL